MNFDLEQSTKGVVQSSWWSSCYLTNCVPLASYSPESRPPALPLLQGRYQKLMNNLVWPNNMHSTCMPFHLHAIPPACHSTCMPFHLHAIPPACHSTCMPFHLHAIPPACHSTCMPFHLHAIPPACSMLHLPARSTRFMAELLVMCWPVLFLLFWMKVMATMVWARLLVAFMLVEAMVRFLVPSAILSSMSL